MVQVDQSVLNRIFGAGSHFGNFINEYKAALIVLMAFVVLGCFVILIYNITNLSTSASDPTRRRNAIIGIGISGVCIAILGSLGVFYALVLSLF